MTVEREGMKTMTMKRLTLGLLAIALVPVGADAQSHADHAGAERAAMNYLDGFYEGSREKLIESVHPDVVKFGFWREDGEYELTPMSFEEMLGFADDVKESGRFPDESAPKRVETLDVLDQTAVVKVYAWWGSDYLTMAKYEGQWKIVHVLWQGPAD
jgi:hypothetical protein